MSFTTSNIKADPVDVNALVLDLRELCGLTQEQFAVKLGVAVVTVNRWENYRTKPMPLALRQLRLLLIEMKQLGSEADREIAQCLLEQYFPKDF